jgi:hypothetical protein
MAETTGIGTIRNGRIMDISKFENAGDVNRYIAQLEGDIHNLRSALRSLLPGYRLMVMGMGGCPVMEQMLLRGSGAPHYTNAIMRKDGKEWHIEADWVPHFARAWPDIKRVLGVDYTILGSEMNYEYPQESP